MRKTAHILILIFVITFFNGITAAQAPYKLPPKEVVDMVTAPPPPTANISPSGDRMALVTMESMPSIAYMSQPLLRIAGTRITPLNNSSQVTRFVTGITIQTIEDGTKLKIALPGGSHVSFPRWSFDGKWLAFLRFLDNGVEIWAVEAETGKAKPLTQPVINAVITSGFTWLPDSHSLLAYTINEDRGEPPLASNIPVGPNIQEAYGKVAKVWTYQDLLQTVHDEDLFEYYATSQIIEIDVASGDTKKISGPAIFMGADASPNGEFLLVYRIKRPFSFSVPYYSFTHSVEIWDREGNLVHMLAALPVADEVPMRGVPTGVRSTEWRPLHPATLIWTEALDGGDPENDVEHRDKVMTLSVPFKDEPKEIIKVQHRYSGLSWLQDVGKAFLTEFDWKRRWRTTWLLDTDDPDFAPKKVVDLSYQDRYNDPGRPVHTLTRSGEYVIIQDGDWIYLSGSGASPEGDRPFLDKMNIETMKAERLFHCAESNYERFVDFSGGSREKIITEYESKTEPPNYFLVDLKTSERKALTDYQDPAPKMTSVKKQLIKYTREDGVELSGTLYLPPDYNEGDRLPLVIWAYPVEYSDPDIAGQVRGSPHTFTFYRGDSQLFFVAQGYALLDGAQMPVVGDPKTMNDTFVQQIVGNAKAAIDTLDEMGVIDPKRVGVGGHSYGAFMTANLLAHCDLFAAGIARSGAFNRTLTPFGFQNERRTLWEAPEVYFKVSPFMHADKINEPILLIHGEADNNSGTFPIQSQRLFHALKGHGGTVRLVMLPNESHGYRAKESTLHVLYEQFQWFDKYIKNKK